MGKGGIDVECPYCGNANIPCNWPHCPGIHEREDAATVAAPPPTALLVPLGADEKLALLMARHARLGARAPRALRTMGDRLVVRVFGYLHEWRFPDGALQVATAPQPVVVTGAGGPGFNTTFHPSGTSDGVPSYAARGWLGTGTLRRRNGVWLLAGSAGVTRYQSTSSNGDLPPAGGWESLYGRWNPAPTLRVVGDAQAPEGCNQCVMQ